MKETDEVIAECKLSYVPNQGIIALAQHVWDEPDFCIKDWRYDRYRQGYRCDCDGRGACHIPEYMLACVVTLNCPMGDVALEIYNNAMK